jgi:hypothetical protein
MHRESTLNYGTLLNIQLAELMPVSFIRLIPYSDLFNEAAVSSEYTALKYWRTSE